MRLAAALLLLMGCASTAHAPPVKISVRAEVLQFLDRMHSEFDQEYVVCLTGHAVADTLVVTGIDPTWVTRYDVASVVYRRCSPPRLGPHHNHPNGRCGFSTVDSLAFTKQEARLALVSCGDGVFAWKTVGDEGFIRVPW